MPVDLHLPCIRPSQVSSQAWPPPARDMSQPPPIQPRHARQRLARGMGAACLLALPLLALAGEKTRSTVERDAQGRWELRLDGQPFAAHGVGGTGRLALAAEIGANAVRTWGADHLALEAEGRPFIDRAGEAGLHVLAGLWLAHERSGFNYDDPAQLAEQRERIRAEVRRYRDHRAIFAWGLGNEMEGPDQPVGREAVWREVEYLARLVKEEDPTRLIVTTIAGASPAKLRAMQQYCPSVDIVGLNLYAGAPFASHELDAAGWDRPFMLTEFGPPGPWEVPSAPWGAPIEPDTNTKLSGYLSAMRSSWSDPQGRCVGVFAFVWKQKQEATGTWFGMFLRSGEKTPMVDLLAKEFTGRWPANRAPRPTPLRLPFAHTRLAPGAEVVVDLRVTDPDGDPLTFEWIVTSESTDRRSGGDPEQAPPDHPECLLRTEASRAWLRLPDRPGAYRLFVYVRDGKGGGASENVTFFIQP